MSVKEEGGAEDTRRDGIRAHRMQPLPGVQGATGRQETALCGPQGGERWAERAFHGTVPSVNFFL